MENERRFYVYIHFRVSDGSPFYVGKGSGCRATWFHGRSEYWNRVKEKHGVRVEIVADGLTEDESHSIEIQLIKAIGRKNLCNHTDGGEGMSGWKISEETRAKLSDIRKGRKHTDEAKKKMSKARKGVKKSDAHNANVSESLKGRRFSEEHRRNLSRAMTKRKFNPAWGRKSGESRSKKVLCINNGNEYTSTKHAALELGLDSSSVSRVCTGLYKHTKGYLFRYI